jgi:5-methyltetrahydrofolate corrinoid/iron sulfur protein methyltransferase
LRRAPLAGAVDTRDPAPLLARARRQLAAGAHALDLNVGRGDADSGGALRWATAVLRDGGVTAPFWLDCGDMTALSDVLRAVPAGPYVANALVLAATHGPAMHTLLAACAHAGAGVAFSPRAADASVGSDALHAAHAHAHDLVRAHAISEPCYFDCLAYPPAHDRARTLRSLAWLRLLRGDPSLAPLVAVGNVAFGAAPALRGPLRRAYAACAVGAGARALIAPVEDVRLRAAVAVASGERSAADDTERWWYALAQAARDATPLPPPLVPDETALAVSALLQQ